jgi:predicted component of type VI protein secretion system
MVSPVLVVLTGKHKGKRVRLAEGETIIGRDAAVKIRVATHEVSRQHCLLLVSDDGVLVRDLGSRNGTFINGIPIAEETMLHPGDTLTTGPMTFELEGTESGKKPLSGLSSIGKPKNDPKASDDDIANWLTDDTSEGISSSDTTIQTGRPKVAEPASTAIIPMAAKPKTPKKEFKSVAEEAEDIIRRHNLLLTPLI